MLSKLFNLFSNKPSSLYDDLGKEEGLKTLVQNFYQYMEESCATKECLELHPLENGKIPQSSKDKLFMFLSGWLGGPNLFIENIGPPRMRARHMKFKITNQEKEQWLLCMQNALNKHPYKVKNKTELLNSFTALAIRITNS